MCREVPTLIRGGNTGTVYTGERHSEDQLSWLDALKAISHAPDARIAASPLAPSAAAPGINLSNTSGDGAAGGVSEESSGSAGLCGAAAAGLDRAGRKRGREHTSDDEESVGIDGLGAEFGWDGLPEEDTEDDGEPVPRLCSPPTPPYLPAICQGIPTLYFK